jgi:hypothetical protein
MPFTLTLDVDLKSVGDKEAFKRGVIGDVASAAKIDAKHVKVTALRAGSVIVDMLIAKEAGDAQKIVRDLEEQLKSPNSLLMQGKLTSKTKKGTSAAAPLALKLPPAPSSGARKSTFGLNLSHAALSSVQSTPSRSSSAERGVLAPSTVVLRSSAEKERGETGRDTNGVSHAPVDAPRQVSLKKKKFVWASLPSSPAGALFKPAIALWTFFVTFLCSAAVWRARRRQVRRLMELRRVWIARRRSQQERIARGLLPLRSRCPQERCIAIVKPRARAAMQETVAVMLRVRVRAPIAY